MSTQRQAPWEIIIENAESWNAPPQEEITERATKWHSCAVGECLADIGIDSLTTSFVVRHDRDLDGMGNRFDLYIRAAQWAKAKKCLGEIRDHIRHRRNAILAEWA